MNFEFSANNLFEKVVVSMLLDKYGVFYSQKNMNYLIKSVCVTQVTVI